MSHDPHVSTPILTSIKKLLAALGLLIFAMHLFYSAAVQSFENGKDRPIVSAMVFFGFYVLMWSIAELRGREYLTPSWRAFRIIWGIVAMALALDEMIQFATDGAPAITWPMQNEWSAHFIAIGIIVFCAVDLIPRALTWLTDNISKYS